MILYQQQCLPWAYKTLGLSTVNNGLRGSHGALILPSELLATDGFRGKGRHCIQLLMSLDVLIGSSRFMITQMTLIISSKLQNKTKRQEQQKETYKEEREDGGCGEGSQKAWQVIEINVLYYI